MVAARGDTHRRLGQRRGLPVGSLVATDPEGLDPLTPASTPLRRAAHPHRKSEEPEMMSLPTTNQTPHPVPMSRLAELNALHRRSWRPR